ncbi:MAG: GNAT family N-acetyltransferase [Faecousia sp.]
MFCEADILNLNNHPELVEKYARWQHGKWGVPVQAYLDSMAEAKHSRSGVPAWYAILDEAGNIVAGLGVIENDFHKRPDLAPNVCAVYVEEAFRKQGLARLLLNHVCRELAKKGIHDAYLITTHTDFYEHCGWSFFTMVEEDGGNMVRMYHKHT